MPTPLAFDQLSRHLDQVASSSDLTQLLRTSARLSADLAADTGGDRTLRCLLDLADTDGFAALITIEALGQMNHPSADRALVDFLHDSDQLVRRHASWRLGSKAPIEHAVMSLVNQVTVGGIDTLHAHRTLRRWSCPDPRLVLQAVQDLLPAVDRAAGRARLVDLIGVIDHPAADADLLLRADDGAEASAVRAAAVGAIGHRAAPGAERLLRSLARSDNKLGLHALLALDDLESQRRQPDRVEGGRGLRIAQLTLAGEIDGQLSRGGRGDTGGVASLIVSLSEALAERDDVSQVLTIGRGSLTDSITDRVTADDELDHASLPIGDSERPATSSSEMWEHLPGLERSLHRVLRKRNAFDVLHLRMADAGTLAGSRVAAALGIDVCFSLAPDPHSVIQSMQSRGELDRTSFLAKDAEEHLWFRTRLVEHLARTTPRLALFPRRHTEAFIDLADPAENDRQRAIVVPEGIAVATIRRAEAELHRPQPINTPPDGDVLVDLANQIPESRRDLPLLLSVGRLSPVKGMDRLARNWASDPELRESCTLVIVGGSLDNPSPVEQSVLTAISAAVPDNDLSSCGLVLLGGRPRSDVARLLAATVSGYRPGWAPGGVYANGAYKEEFGLAILEALAAGLVVVAPATGGPPTYVDDGDTGILVPADADLAPAVHHAFELVDRPGRQERARRLVEDQYSIETMASRLVELYQPAPALL